MNRRRPAAVAAVIAVAALALVATGTSTRLWRAAYPYLPPRLQAVPYRLRALVGPHPTPVELPTPAGSADAPTPVARPVQATSSASPAVVADDRRAAAPATRPSAATQPGPLPPRPPSARLGAVRHAYQTWNNCGPATISMALSALDLDEGQAQAAVRLKPNPNDKNVSLGELARYAGERGAGTSLRFDGRVEVLEALVAAGLPTIVETWFEPEPGDEMGHYRLVTGYDAAARTLRMSDSYLGPDVVVAYDDFDRDWRAFNRAYLVVHPAARAAEVADRVGPGDTAMWVGAAATAADEVKRAPDAFGWFNLGSSLVGIGDDAGAAAAFDRARAAGLPWRMLWYQFGPFEAYAAVGRWADVEALAKANLANAPDLEESSYWLGRARQAAGDADGARANWRQALDLNPLYDAPALAIADMDAGTRGDP